MKKIILSLACILLIGGGCTIETPITTDLQDKPLEQEQPLTYSGTWQYEDSEQSLMLTLDQNENDVTGYHCYTKANIHDCINNTLTWSIVGRIQDDGTALIDIMSARILDTGKVKLKLTDPTTLSWQMLEQPPGQDDFPNFILLKK